MKSSSRVSRNSGRTRFPLFSLALLLGAALGGCGAESPAPTEHQAVSERANTSATRSVGHSKEITLTRVDPKQTREITLEAAGGSIDLSRVLIQEEDGAQRSLAAILGQSSLPAPDKGFARIQITDATPEQLTCDDTATPDGCSERRIGSDSTTELRCVLLGCNPRYCYWYCY